MMRTIYLTEQEHLVFDVLSDQLREGWQTEAELLHYDDSTLKRHTRISLMRLHDPALQTLQKSVHAAATMKEVTDAIEDVDFSLVSDSDLAQLFFALGPDVLSHIILTLLAQARTDEDMEKLTALTVLRHEILASFQLSA